MTDPATPSGSDPAPHRAPTMRAPRTRESFKDVLWRNIATVLMVAVAFGVAATFSLATDSFLTTANLQNLLRQAAPLLIVASAMTLVITTGQIDLSVGSTLALSGAVAATLLQGGLDSSIVIVTVLAIGAMIGAVNGWFSAYQGVPSFIVTLGGLTAIRGVALLITEGFSIPISRDLFFITLGRGQIFGLFIPAVLAVAVWAVLAVLLSRMRFGQYVTGIGANAESVRRAGVNVRRIKLAVLVLSSMAAALAGMMVAARLGSGSANAGVAFELTAISAVVLGGTNLFGGKGTLVGTLVGTLIIAMVENGLILMGVSPFITPVITGVILVLAVWANAQGFGRLSQVRRTS